MNNIRVVCNASPIIALLSIHKLPLLWEIFREVVLPEAVYRELCAGSPRHAEQIMEIKQAVEHGNITLYQVKNAEAVSTLYGKLHYGELEVIIAAKELDIKLAVIDEQAARKLASELLVDTIGIIGILLLAKEYKKIPKVKPYINHLMKNGYWISEKLYWEALIRAKEDK